MTTPQSIVRAALDETHTWPDRDMAAAHVLAGLLAGSPGALGSRAPEGMADRYVVGPEAWWRAAVLGDDEIIVTREPVDPHAPSPAAGWEFTIGLSKTTGALYVHVFDEAWRAFQDRPEVFDALGDMEGANLDDVAAMLAGYGFTDVTERERPASAPEPTDPRVVQVADTLGVHLPIDRANAERIAADVVATLSIPAAATS